MLPALEVIGYKNVQRFEKRALLEQVRRVNVLEAIA